MSQHKSLYNTKRWKDRRKAQLFEFPMCKFCEELAINKAAKVADHIVPHRGNEELFYYGLLQSLCWTCHSGAKQRQENTGVLVGGNAQGFPSDPNHIWNK